MKTIFLIILWGFSILIYSQTTVNPDISLIGTTGVFSDLTKGISDYGKLSFIYPSAELFIDGYLNPYSRGTAVIAFEEGTIILEELYLQILRGLPLDLQLEAGKYLVNISKTNTVHPHAWPFLDRPLFHRIYFGEEGFNDIGININSILPTESFYSEFNIGIYKGDAISKIGASDPEDILTSNRGNTPIVVGRLSTFFELSDYSFLDVGVSGSYGVHAKSDFTTFDSLAGRNSDPLYFTYGVFDTKYKYKPDAYTVFTFQGEAVLNNRDVMRTEGTRAPYIHSIRKINTYGYFISADLRFYKQFNAGLKYDFTNGIIGDTPSSSSLANDNENSTRGYSAWVGYSPVEETLVIRAGVQHLRFNFTGTIKREPETVLQLQAVFSLGPHKAHLF